MKTPKPDAPCDSKRPNCDPFRKAESEIPYAFPAFTGGSATEWFREFLLAIKYGASHN
jgi:hypothetical protein